MARRVDVTLMPAVPAPYNYGPYDGPYYNCRALYGVYYGPTPGHASDACVEWRRISSRRGAGYRRLVRTRLSRRHQCLRPALPTPSASRRRRGRPHAGGVASADDAFLDRSRPGRARTFLSWDTPEARAAAPRGWARESNRNRGAFAKTWWHQMRSTEILTRSASRARSWGTILL
jgi:hypothetical protein